MSNEHGNRAQRLLATVVAGMQLVGFALMCLVGLPMILVQFFVAWVRKRIQTRWPDNDRALMISFWIGLLWPVLMILVLCVALWFATAHVRSLHRGERGLSSTELQHTADTYRFMQGTIVPRSPSLARCSPTCLTLALRAVPIYAEAIPLRSE